MRSGQTQDRTVFIAGLVLVLVIVCVGVMFPQWLGVIGNDAMNWLARNFGWLYNGAAFSYVVFCFVIGLSRYGNVRLGSGPPEYSFLIWFAMLFSAGMGIGLVFWGAAEPLYHWISPISPIESGSREAAEFAMRKSFVHWGLQPWGIYAVLGLPLAYLMHCRGQSCLISNLLLPFTSRKGGNKGWGLLINILALQAIAAGVATSLGLGVQQISSGLSFVFDVPDTTTIKIVMVGMITLLVIVCSVTGMQSGIKYMSGLNMIIAGTVLVSCFMLGPTIEILNTFTNSLGNYIHYWFSDSLAISDNPWYASWTVFYMAWWISWAPFCAPFIARISRGRTLREFVLGVLLAPSIGSFLWFAVFGTLGIHAGQGVAEAALQSTSTALFVVLNEYPLGGLISLLFIFVLFTFYITSANGATYVLATLSTGGDINPSARISIVWAVLPSLLALVLMLGSDNGLCLLQTASIVAAFPFMLVLFLGMHTLIRLLHEDYPRPCRTVKKEHRSSEVR